MQFFFGRNTEQNKYMNLVIICRELQQNIFSVNGTKPSLPFHFTQKLSVTTISICQLVERGQE
jgi:hypothetical protein